MIHTYVVIGERRLLRFIKGYNGNIEKAAEAYSKFLKWRRENNVDEIRNKIVYGGINHPKGEFHLRHHDGL